MQEDRQIQIENDNRRLLNNISKILKRNKVSQKSAAASSRASSASSSRRSLNGSARKQENARIEKENKVRPILHNFCV